MQHILVVDVTSTKLDMNVAVIDCPLSSCLISYTTVPDALLDDIGFVISARPTFGSGDSEAISSRPWMLAPILRLHAETETATIKSTKNGGGMIVSESRSRCRW